ncbi:MAG: cysteine--tRNA ligase [Bacillota bacterium]
MSLRVFNTLSGRKEELETRDPGRVSIYICGVTPYSSTHLGHARPSVFWDTVIRYLRYRGFEVRAVQNVTDVNEKVAARAALEGVGEYELAARYHREYDEIMEELGVRPVDEYPWVSDHMDDILEMIEALVRRGHAYEVDGDIYFNVTTFPAYGKLSGQTPEDLVAGARVDVDDRKRHPADFALWKSAQEGMQSWDSPWGKGRPGWHIECSAMAVRYLGFGFDMHGGGTDLIFPHHENEIAQSEAQFGDEPFVRYWIHHGMVTGEDGKMSKSLGNFVTVREILDEFRPEVVRHFLLSVHYSKPLTFSERRVEEAERAWHRLVNSVSAVRGHLLREPRTDVILADEEADPLKEAGEKLGRDFCAAMDDDFNTPRAMAAIFEAVRSVNATINAPDFVLSAPLHDVLADLSDQIEIYAGILGIWPREGIESVVQKSRAVLDSADPDRTEALIDILIEVRERARKQKLWELADLIRDRLAALGLQLEDTPEGTRLKRGELRGEG